MILVLPRLPLGALFREREAKFHLSLDFIDASVESCPPECNRPAHELAALGAGQVHGDHMLLWLTNCPDAVKRLMTDDLVQP